MFPPSFGRENRASSDPRGTPLQSVSSFNRAVQVRYYLASSIYNNAARTGTQLARVGSERP